MQIFFGDEGINEKTVPVGRLRLAAHLANLHALVQDGRCPLYAIEALAGKDEGQPLGLALEHRLFQQTGNLVHGCARVRIHTNVGASDQRFQRAQIGKTHFLAGNPIARSLAQVAGHVRLEA